MKQETLEEAAEKEYPTIHEQYQYDAFIEGAKWQKENSNINALEFEIKALKSLIQDMDATIKSKYSEEEVLEMLNPFGSEKYIKQWFEQFKKK